VLRAVKNRFGSVAEMGVFEMRAAGLVGVDNPSAMFLAERQAGVPGSAVAGSLEGSRPLLVEVQALVASAAGSPRRTALGVDPLRVSLLLAVLERRAGVGVSTEDVYVNVAGGVRLDEPAIDLAITSAVASSHLRRACDPRAFVFGEVGLAGEVRAVSLPELRLAEAEKLGFQRCILPEAIRKRLSDNGQKTRLELVGVSDVEAALKALLG
jgi:DNA repair protein RadA/Sms